MTTELTGPVLRALDGTGARWIRVRPAAEVCAALGRRAYLHAGPPIDVADVVGPVRGALLGALVLESEAADLQAAQRVLDAGAVRIAPCHDHGGVGAMAGIVTPSMPVVVIDDGEGRTTFAPLNEGLGSALRFGSNDNVVLQRLRWLRDIAAPLLDAALETIGGIDVVELQCEGLRRGDECHNRNIASTAAVLAMLAPAIARRAASPGEAADVLAFIAGNPHFFLSLSIAAGKAIADRAHSADGDPGIVTAMCANGREFGIRVSGLGDRWFVAEAPVGRPKLFEGYSLADVCPTLGDSFITETIGLGAFALSASPALSRFVGGDPIASVKTVEQLRGISRGTSSRFMIPFEGFRGTPLGIDVNRIATSGVAPLVNNGLAHREPGYGQVGAGLTRLPLGPFVAAAQTLRGRFA